MLPRVWVFLKATRGLQLLLCVVLVEVDHTVLQVAVILREVVPRSDEIRVKI